MGTLCGWYPVQQLLQKCSDIDARSPATASPPVVGGKVVYATAQFFDEVLISWGSDILKVSSRGVENFRSMKIESEISNHERNYHSILLFLCRNAWKFV